MKRFLKRACIQSVFVFSPIIMVAQGQGLDVPDNQFPALAFKNVTLHQGNGTQIEHATLVWRNGVIQSFGKDISIPFDARVIDGGDSLHVYPGFINGLANWGAPEVPRQLERAAKPGEPSYERAGIQPDRSTIGHLNGDAQEFQQAQNMGFTMAAIALHGFMLPGQIDVYHLRSERPTDYIFRENIGQKTSFNGSRGVYPSTTMAVMARLRQLMLDARTQLEHQTLYETSPTLYSLPGKDRVLEALYPIINRDKPFFYSADSREDISRILKLSDELAFNVVLVSGKYAYTHKQELARRKIPVLVTIDLTEQPDFMKKQKVEDDSVAVKTISDEEMAWRERQQKAWKDEVTNIRQLLDAGVNVGLATNGLRLNDFRKKISLLHEYGELSETEIIGLLTKNNAEILGIAPFTGDITNGKIANFTVTSSSFLHKNTKHIYTVSAGDLHEVKQTPARTGTATRRN